MFQRVRESVSNRYANAHTARRKKITRRRIKASAQPSGQGQGLEESQRTSNSSHNNNNNHDQTSYDDTTDDNDNDNLSVHSTITLETTRTASNENRKQLADPNYRPPTQVFVEASNDPTRDPIEVLERAQSDITKSSIYLKGIAIGKQVASACLSLVRGDNRSWEAIAVDILRQKARWDNITMEDTSGEYLDTLLGFCINLDNVAFLHLSNIILTPNAAWTFTALGFSKQMTKLQLDLIDLSFAMPLLCQGLHANNSIRCLIASRCGLNDDRLHELFTSLPKQLKELRIFGNKCREKGLAAITAVIFHSQTLQILDLSYQHVDPNPSSKDEFDVSWLLGALHHNRTLKVLDLDNDGIDDGHMTHLCAALVENDTLEEVMLNHNRITAHGIALLSSKFGQMKGLKKISMYSNLFDAPQVNHMVHNNNNNNNNNTNNNATTNSGNGGNRGDVAPKQPSQPRPTTVEISTDDEMGSSSDLDDEFKDDLDGDDGIEYEEETVAEDETNVEEDDDDDDNDEDLDYLDDNSSAPPPSADFREPSEAENDLIPDDDDNDDDDNDGDDEAETEGERNGLATNHDRDQVGKAEQDGGETNLPVIEKEGVEQDDEPTTFVGQTDGGSENNVANGQDETIQEVIEPTTLAVAEGKGTAMNGDTGNRSAKELQSFKHVNGVTTTKHGSEPDKRKADEDNKKDKVETEKVPNPVTEELQTMQGKGVPKVLKNGAAGDEEDETEEVEETTTGSDPELAPDEEEDSVLGIIVN